MCFRPQWGRFLSLTSGSFMEAQLICLWRQVVVGRMVSSEIASGSVAPCPWFEPKSATQFDAEIASRIAGIPGPGFRNACLSPFWGTSSRRECTYDEPPCSLNRDCRSTATSGE